MVISTSTLAEVVEGIHKNLKESIVDIKYLIKLHDIFASSRQGPEEASVLKNIFEVIVDIYESQVDITGDRDIQCHVLVGECYDYLLNVLKKNTIHNKDLCLKAIDVLIAVTKRQSQSFNIIFKFVSHALLDIITCTQLNITERKEFMKALNFVLENTERKLRYKLRDELKLENLSKLLYTCGDYEIQANLIETLYRYTSVEERKTLARKWMNDNNEIIASFLSIKDFEPDCRKFLIKFNDSLKDDSLVISLPCLKAVIGGCELEKPEDPNCEEFWIDFNLGSSSVSIVCSQESLYSNSIYGSQITPGFWETLNVEYQSVNKVSLQDAVSFQFSGTMKEDAFEICMTLLQPCNVVFSFPSNFEGNMVVITFSMQYLRKTEKLIKRLFPENWTFNVKKNPSLKKVKSSIAHLSPESISSIISSEPKTMHWIDNKSKGKPVSANKSRAQPKKDLLDRSISSSTKSQDFRTEEKRSNEKLKSGNKICGPKSPFRPLEIIISPSCNKKGLLGVHSAEKSLLQTPEGHSLSKTDPETYTPGKSVGSKDTGFYTMSSPQPGSFDSEEQEKEDLSKFLSVVNLSPVHSHRKTVKKICERNEMSINKIQKSDNAKPESRVSSEVISKRVLRSRKRFPMKNDLNEETQETSFHANEGKNISQGNHTSGTKGLGMVEKPLGKEANTIGEDNSTKTKQNSQRVKKENLLQHNSKHPTSTTNDSSDDESASSWMKLVRSAQKNKLTSTKIGLNEKLPIKSTVPENNVDKYETSKNTHECNKIVEQKNSLKGAEQEVEDGKKNYSQSRGQNKRLSTRKKLFNSSENSLLVPLGQSLGVMEDALCAPLQASKPKFFNARNRKTFDPSMSILRNWASGTESELSWLTEGQANKSSLNKNAKYSYQRNKDSGRRLGEKLNHTVRNLIGNSMEEDARMHENVTSNKNKGERLRERKVLRPVQVEVLDTSSDEDYTIKGKSKKSKQRNLNAKKGTFTQDKRANAKRNTIATTRQLNTFENSPPQHDFEVERESTLKNANLRDNFTNGSRNMLLKEKKSGASANPISKTPVIEKEVESYEKNHGPNNVLTDQLVPNKNLNSKTKEKSPIYFESHQLTSKDKGIAHGLTSFNSMSKSSKKQDVDHRVIDLQKSSHLQGSNERDSNISHQQQTRKNVIEDNPKKDNAMHKALGIQLTRHISPENGGESSDSPTNIYEKQMQDQPLTKETTPDTTHGNITEGRARKKGCETTESQILTIMDSHSHKNVHDNLSRKESPLGTTHENKNQIRQGRKGCRTSETEVSPNLENQRHRMQKSKHNQVLVKESAVDSIHDSMTQVKNGAKGCNSNDTKFSQEFTSPSNSESEGSSSSNDDENYIPPSRVEEKTVLPINKSFSGKEGILCSKNVTKRRGSCFISQDVEQRKKMKYSSVNKSLDPYHHLGNKDNFYSNDTMVKSQGRKRTNDYMNKSFSELTFSADSIPAKKLKGLEKKLRTLEAKKEMSPRISPEKPERRSIEEIELDKLISEFHTTTKTTERNKADKAYDLTEKESDYLINTIETDLKRPSGHAKHSKKAIPKDRIEGNFAQGIKRPSTSVNTKMEQQINKRKTHPHLLKGYRKEDDIQDDEANDSGDPILDISRTVERLFKRHNAIKVESFNDMRQHLLRLIAEASEDLKLENEKTNNFGDIEEKVKILSQSLEKDNSLLKRFEKCYKYLYNTSLMKSENDDEIKKSLEEIKKLSEENVKSLSKLNTKGIHETYKDILTSKVAKLKEKCFQLEQKKEMVKNLHYVKSLILK